MIGATCAGRAYERGCESFQRAAWWEWRPAAPLTIGRARCSPSASSMAAEFVQPFRKSRAGKNDRNDAEAIAVAVREANMRFVAVKSVEQQARLARHRLREGWKEERTATGNRIRGLLAEFGVAIPKGQGAVWRQLEMPVATIRFAG